MADLVGRAIERLKVANVRLDRGLSDAEVSRIEDQFGFTFGPEHRELIQSVLPVGQAAWPDWRRGSPDDLRGRLDWPIDGVIFDVQNNAFWPFSWGQRPVDRPLRRIARAFRSGPTSLTVLRFGTCDALRATAPAAGGDASVDRLAKVAVVDGSGRRGVDGEVILTAREVGLPRCGCVVATNRSEHRVVVG